MTAKTRTLVILLGGIALILLIFAVQLLFPGEKSIQQTIGNATISFTADRRLLALPGECVTVEWQVDHIKAVYIQGTPTVGEGLKEICVDETTMPVLRVKFEDNNQTEYPLKIDFLIDLPSTWFLASAAVVLVLAILVVAISRPATPIVQSAGRRAPRIVWFFAGIGAVVTGLVVLGLVLELGLRFYFSQFGTPDEQSAYLDSRAEIEARQSDVIGLPFVEYGLSPNFPGQNSLGYRGDNIQVPKPAGVFRIVILGDSVTYGTTTPYDETYPYYLQQVLRDEYGDKNVEVVNAGVPGYTSWNSLIDLSLRTIELQPDLVIIYQGGDDVLPREVSPDCYSSPSPFLGLDPRRHLRAEPGELSPSTLYRFIATKLGWMADSTAGAGGSIESTITCDQTHLDPAQNVPANAPVYFEQHVREMIGIARASGFPIMFSTYAYNHNSQYALPYWRAAVAQDNAITTQVAQENAALLLDYASLAPEDDSYWSDSIHMTSKGNMFQAEAFAKFLVAQGILTGGAKPSS